LQSPKQRGRQPSFASGKERELGSGYLAAIQPVGDLVGVITPLAPHSVRRNASRTGPFPQSHGMHVYQFAQFGEVLNPMASLSIYFSKAAVDLRAGLLASQLRICQITKSSFQ
jgi:hypothetical protein